MNYLGEFHQSHPDLDNHPLRIFRTPVLSGALSKEEQILARIKANAKEQAHYLQVQRPLGFQLRLFRIMTRAEPTSLYWRRSTDHNQRNDRRGRQFLY